ncbi:MAG: UDP-4-amino-4,6-dideoxy-N-acetyl-beta-L-altrosamine N-acetyltransferase [Oscillospiraceae bacterium]|nr:UDP-4-amino-4,6-dideoxy-N-acetyl-beta-L-altrosamine N-acetyltransferase [Oscillospiraceae bacterium]
MIIPCSENITLRSISEEDTDKVLRWRNSGDVVKYFNYQEEVTEADHADWLETKVKTGKVYQFIIHDSSLGKDVGTVYIKDIDNRNHKAEYGVFIGEKDAAGRGTGTIVAKAMIAFSFEKLHLHRLYLQVHADNTRAIRCYERAGFSKEALLKDDVFVNGKYCDLVIMGIVREDR